MVFIQQICLLFVLIIWSSGGLATENVILRPQTVVQAEGVNAHFHCNIHISALDITWRINEVSHLPNATTQFTGSTGMLTITALAMYNGTAIQCGAFVYDGGLFRTEWSNRSLLRVQGLLSSVRNLVITSDASRINCSWLPPFTLNLTTTEPDIVYCVSVLLVHNEVKTHIVSNCSVLTNEYSLISSNSPHLEDHYYEVTVIPRSNVNGATNGSATTVLGPTPTETECVDRITAGLRHSVNFELYARTYMNDESCDLNISNTDSSVDSTVIMCSVEYSIMCTFKGSNCTQVLLPNMLYTATGYCKHFSLLSVLLSTHELHKVDIGKVSNYEKSNTSEIPDLVVTCHYAAVTREATTVGCFTVALGWDRAAPPLYRAVYREDNLQMNSTITIREGGRHYANFYEIERNQFPTKYPALTETLEMSRKDNHTSIIDIVGSTSELLCINCNSSTKVCLAVYHRCFYEELPFPLSIMYTNKHDGQSETCIALSPGCYWVAVFGLDMNGRMEDMPMIVKMVHILNQERNENSSHANDVYKSTNFEKNNMVLTVMIAGPALSLLLCIALTVCTISIVTCRCCHKNKRKQKEYDEKFEMESCAAYEVVKYQSQHYHQI